MPNPQQLITTIVTFYPSRVLFEDAVYEQSAQWQLHLALRRGTRAHKKTTGNIYQILSECCGPDRVHDDSCPSLHPSYQFRVLCTPKAKWPHRWGWNWDVKLAKRCGSVVWVDLFFSYLGPFFTGVVHTYRSNNQGLFHRYSPLEESKAALLSPKRLGKVLHGWEYVNHALVRALIPGIVGDIGVMNGSTVFSLLFNNTYPGPAEWNGKWQPLEDAPQSQFASLARSKRTPTVGQLIHEAGLRGELEK